MLHVSTRTQETNCYLEVTVNNVVAACMSACYCLCVVQGLRHGFLSLAALSENIGNNSVEVKRDALQLNCVMCMLFK